MQRTQMGSLSPAPAGVRTRRMSLGRLLIVLALLALVLCVLVYLAIGAYVASKLTQPARHAQVMTPAAFGVPFEDVTVRSRDGLSIAGWFMPAAGSPRAVILVHGKDACRSCEFQGRFAEFGTRLRANGFNVLMIDLRGHGQSQGAHWTMGVQERWDVLGGVDWLQQGGFTQIAVLGVSLGAASAVEAAADPNGGQALRAVVLDSGFGSLRELLDARFPGESHLPLWFLPGSLLMGRIMIQTDLNAIRPVADIVKFKAPLMLIFSEQDDLVPLVQFKAMAVARPDAETWLLPDAGHARVYTAHPDEYVARVTQFLDKALR